MKQIISIGIVAMFIMTGLSVLPEGGITMDAEAVDFNYYSDAALDGMLAYWGPDYGAVLNATAPDSGADTAAGFIYAGQKRSNDGVDSFVFRGYLSFDTSVIPSGFEVLSVDLFAKVYSTAEVQAPFSVMVNNLDYGGALTIDDWNTTGALEGTLAFATDLEPDQWISMPLLSSNINPTGTSQYRLASSNEGTEPGWLGVDSPILEYVQFYSADTAGTESDPYLAITARSSGGAILFYEITQYTNTTSDVPKTMNVTYYKAHNEEAHLNESWENDSFLYNNWITTGSPVIQNWTVYEGNYSAGAIVNLSGTGSHSFTISQSTSQHKWVNIDYARMTSDVGQGTPVLQLDWWDGNHWIEIEYLSGTNAWGRNSANLSLIGGDNNPDFKLRVSMEFLTPNNNANAVWIDNIYINASEMLNATYCDTVIYPAEILDYNDTHEVLRYEIFTSDLLISLNMTLNSSMVFASINPCWLIDTGVSGGDNYYNISTWLHRFEEIYTHIWFFKAKYSSSTTTTYFEPNIIYPTEITTWNNTHELIKYTIFYRGQFATALLVNNTYTYVSVNPNATITADVFAGLYGIDTNATTSTHIWFTRPSTTPTTQLHIQLWHSTLGEGFFWEKWKVTINPGLSYNNTTATWISNPNYLVNYGINYTIAVLDYFGNYITGHSFVANSYSMDILIPVNVFSVTFNSFRNDTTAFAVYFNATGTPYQDHCSGGKEVKMAIREGTYMFRFDYLTSNVTGHTTLEATYFYNLTINGTYTINFGAGGIGILFTSISGIEILIANIATNMAYQDINWVLDDPIYALGGTKAAGGVFVLDADPNIVIDSTAEFIQIDSTAGAATLWGGHIDESLMFGDWAYFSDFLTISCSNTSARLVINDTTLSTVLISTSAPSGATFDIFSDNGSSVGNNLTAWVSDGSFALRRTIYFRWARELSWNFQANNDYYFAYATINNSLPTVLRNPTVLITFPELQEDQQINFEKIEVEDMDNNLVLPEGQNYTVDNTGISFGMRQISPSTVRQFKLSLYTQNATREGTEYIQAQEVPVTETYKSKNYRMVYGDYTNEESSTFTGNIVFILTHEETKDILSNTVRVIDQITGFELVPNGDYVFTGSVVNIFPSYVGEIGQGEIIKIKVYYLTDETAGMAAVSVDIGGVPLWGVVYIILIIAGLIAAVLYAWGNKKKGHKKFGESMGKFIIVVGIAATFLMVVYSLVGGYGLS